MCDGLWDIFYLVKSIIRFYSGDLLSDRCFSYFANYTAVFEENSDPEESVSF